MLRVCGNHRARRKYGSYPPGHGTPNGTFPRFRDSAAGHLLPFQRMDAVQISHVTRTFGSVTAVDDLSLTVPQGSIYGFIGPNGVSSADTCFKQTNRGRRSLPTASASFAGIEPRAHPPDPVRHGGHPGRIHWRSPGHNQMGAT